MQPLRVYADTSVYGGGFDEEFSEPTRKFFEQVRQGRFRLVVSPIVAAELQDAPAEVRALFEEMAARSDRAEQSAEAVQLSISYMQAGIVGTRGQTDALHVAIASTSGCRAIVSWNFKHIVHFEKIPLYNAINKVKGYGEIAIHSPQEVIHYEDKDI